MHIPQPAWEMLRCTASVPMRILMIATINMAQIVRRFASAKSCKKCNSIKSAISQLHKESRAPAHSSKPFRHPLPKQLYGPSNTGRPFFVPSQDRLTGFPMLVARTTCEQGARTLADSETTSRLKCKWPMPGLRRRVAASRGCLAESCSRQLGLAEGDIVEITGKRTTASIAVGPYDEDEGIDVLRLDGLQRANAGVGTSDFVTLRKAESKPATRKSHWPPRRTESAVAGSGQALQAQFHAPPDGRRRCRRDRRATAGRARQYAAATAPDAGRPGLRSAGNPADRGVDHAQGHRPYRRKYRDRAAARICRGQGRARRADVTYDDIGGMGDTIDQLREMVELPLRYPELFQRLGVDPPKGVLLYGPPGTGKTRLARAVANESEAEFFLINGPEIMGSAYGESEKALRDVFEKAAKAAPSIIFIDEIDSIAPKRGQVSGEAEKRLVAQLLTLMDGIEPRANLVVIAATNRPDAIDEALRRPGRFDREIVVGVPDERGRREILAIHTRGMPLEEAMSISASWRAPPMALSARISPRWPVRQRSRRCGGSCRASTLTTTTIPPEVLDELCVTREDFVGALKRVQPSAMREVMVQVPNVRWSDIGGLDAAARAAEAKASNCRSKTPRAFRRLGIRPAKGFLLYGPPGTGKTLLAKAVAREAEANFIATKSSRPAVQMVWRERAADRAAVLPRASGCAVHHLHRRTRQPGCRRAAGQRGRTAGDRAGGEYASGGDGWH